MVAIKDRGRVEVTFGKGEYDKDLQEYLDTRGKIVGKGAYLKQLLYEDMIKNKEKSSSNE